MKSRFDLLMKEIDCFIKKENLKEYSKKLKMDIMLDTGALLIGYKEKEYEIELVEMDSEIYWNFGNDKKILYGEEHNFKYILEKILEGFL